MATSLVISRDSRLRWICAVVALCLPVVSWIVAPRIEAQSTQSDSPAFEVASVKRNMTCQPSTGVYTRETIPESNVPLGDSSEDVQTGGLFSAARVPLNIYIAFAYNIPMAAMQNPVPNAPKWVGGQCFDIQARGPANATKDQMRLMLRKLLAERFKLSAHWQSQNTDVLSLTLAKPGKLGPELRLDTDKTPCGKRPWAGRPIATVAGGYPAFCGGFIGMFSPGSGVHLGARKMTMSALAHYISGDISLGFNRPVIDKTGLAGEFDMKLDYTVDPLGAQPRPGDFQAAFIQALKDDLGLKLESAKGPVNELVVDHIEEPSSN